MKNVFSSKKFLSPQEKRAVFAFLASFKQEKRFLEKLVLFGSKARGDSHKDSDVDILAVIRKKALEEKIYEKVAQILSLFGVYLSVKTFPREEFKRLTKLKTPFLENINKEGVVLWPRP